MQGSVIGNQIWTLFPLTSYIHILDKLFMII